VLHRWQLSAALNRRWCAVAVHFSGLLGISMPPFTVPCPLPVRDSLAIVAPPVCHGYDPLVHFLISFLGENKRPFVVHDGSMAESLGQWEREFGPWDPRIPVYDRVAALAPAD
jgi:hypothetical protein